MAIKNKIILLIIFFTLLGIFISLLLTGAVEAILGGNVSYKIYSISSADLDVGYLKALSIGDKIIFISNNQMHEIILVSASPAVINVSFSQQAQQESIEIGNNGQLDIDLDGNDDISIKFTSYTDNRATMSVSKIIKANSTAPIHAILEDKTNITRLKYDWKAVVNSIFSYRISNSLFSFIMICIIVAIIIIAVYISFRNYHKIKGHSFHKRNEHIA